MDLLLEEGCPPSLCLWSLLKYFRLWAWRQQATCMPRTGRLNCVMFPMATNSEAGSPLAWSRLCLELLHFLWGFEILWVFLPAQEVVFFFSGNSHTHRCAHVRVSTCTHARAHTHVSSHFPSFRLTWICILSCWCWRSFQNTSWAWRILSGSSVMKKLRYSCENNTHLESGTWVPLVLFPSSCGQVTSCWCAPFPYLLIWLNTYLAGHLGGLVG